MAPEDIQVTVARLAERIEATRSHTDQALSQLQRDYGRLDGDIGRVSQKANDVEERAERRIDAMEQRLNDRLAEYATMVSGQINGINEKLDAVLTEFRVDVDTLKEQRGEDRKEVAGMKNRAIGIATGIAVAAGLIAALIVIIVQQAAAGGITL